MHGCDCNEFKNIWCCWLTLANYLADLPENVKNGSIIIAIKPGPTVGPVSTMSILHGCPNPNFASLHLTFQRSNLWGLGNPIRWAEHPPQQFEKDLFWRREGWEEPWVSAMGDVSPTVQNLWGDAPPRNHDLQRKYLVMAQNVPCSFVSFSYGATGLDLDWPWKGLFHLSIVLSSMSAHKQH